MYCYRDGSGSALLCYLATCVLYMSCGMSCDLSWWWNMYFIPPRGEDTIPLVDCIQVAFSHSNRHHLFIVYPKEVYLSIHVVLLTHMKRKTIFFAGGNHGHWDQADGRCDQRGAQCLAVPLPDALPTARSHLLPAWEWLRECESPTTSSATHKYANVSVWCKGVFQCL